MTIENEKEEYQACEACGCSAEIGFVINENDDVASVQVFAQGKALLEAELNNYLELAKTVNPNVSVEMTPIDADSSELTALFRFECSAEKLIFELKSRSLAK